MSKTFTNITELEVHLKGLYQEMFKSSELQDAGRKVYDIMYKNVTNRMHMSGYDYNQSGDFLKAMEGEKKGFDPNSITKTSMKIGFGDIGEGQGLNDPNYGMRKEQKWVLFTNGITMMANGSLQKNQSIVNLKAETQMPKWIVLEFGTRGKAESIPNEFKIGYTRRPDKEVMHGPSRNKPDGYRKSVFAMLSIEKASHLGIATERPHPGTRPGRFFRGGLEDSKNPIYEEFGKAIGEYLNTRGG